METPHPLDRESVACAELRRRVHDERENIDALEGLLEFVHHLAAEHVLGPVNARRVDEDDWRVVAIENALDAVAGRLRLGRDDRDLAPDNRVYERRFARVR